MWSWPMCLSCKHYDPPRNGAAAKCDAFTSSDGIPEEILAGEFDHRKPWSGRDEAGRRLTDHGVRFDFDPRSKNGPSLVEIEAGFIRADTAPSGDEIRASEQALGIDREEDDEADGE